MITSADLPEGPKKYQSKVDWSQDLRCVRIKLPLKGTSIKKIDVFIADLILKINVQEKKYVKLLDLAYEVDCDTKENKVVYSNEFLEVTLIKKEQKTWDKCIVDVSDFTKEQIKERRQNSFKRKEESQAEYQKNLQQLKITHDSHSTKAQMNLDDHAYKDLKKRKKDVKLAAEDEVFDENDEVSSSIKTQVIYTHHYDPEIFNMEDHFYAGDDKGYGVPEVRTKNNIGLDFTERMHPLLAARDTQFVDAPMPRTKQGKFVKFGDDQENKNPLWLKDKGDDFFKNNDFYSAMHCYYKAYNIDKTKVNYLANKAACHLNLFNYEECLIDCKTVMDQVEKELQELEKSKPEEETKEFKTKKQNLTLAKIKTGLRIAICLSWHGSVDDAINTFSKIEEFDISCLEDQTIKQQIQASKELVEKRQQSILIKKQGDLEFKKAQYEKALQKYQESVEIDNNETAIGNISVTYLKMGKNQECIDFCDKCIEKVQKFTRYTTVQQHMNQSSLNSNQFLIKLYLRKAKAQLILDVFHEAKKTIKLALEIDDRNKEARSLVNQIDARITKEQVQKLKQEAAQQMKEKNVAGALEIYNECLKKVDQDDTFEYLALLLNKSACYMHLEKYNDIISTALRGLKITKSFKNRMNVWENKKLSNEQKEKLNNFESRFLVRRANAYLKENSIYNAKSDLQDALQIDPNNEQIKQDLEKVKLILN